MKPDIDLEVVRKVAFDADGPSLEARQGARAALLAAAGRETWSPRRSGYGAVKYPRWRRVRDFSTVGLRAIPVLLAVVVTLAIAVVALVDIRHHAPRRPVSSAAVSGRKQLVDILAVLRRPQTKADLGLSRASLPDAVPFLGIPDLALVRSATVTPWGERLFFVPFKPPTRRSLAAAERQFPERDRAQLAQTFRRLAVRGETLGVYSREGGGGGVPASVIAARGELSTEGAGRAFAGGSTRTRLILVVPDGVAKVVFLLPRQPAGAQNGAPIYRHSLHVAVAVHSNVAAVQVDRQCCTGQLPMIWYAADGHLIKRIGKFSSVNRVIAPPRPGPETALSRAAEQNPSTPNRVWVTPRTGGPRTTFALHFRILLTDADYRYTFTGTRCPGITFPGGSGGGTNDLRGRIFGVALDAVAGQTWCPGTYQVSATVMDLGRAGSLKHPARPFGTATFTVRR
jgi:hypothetical protein